MRWKKYEAPIVEDLKDAATVAFFAFLIFGPFIGLQLSDNQAGNLTLSTRPEAARHRRRRQLRRPARHPALAQLPPGEHRPRPRRQVAKSGKFIAPALLVFAVLMPLTPGLPNAYIDLGVLIMTYVMLGWGLNIVVGLAGLLDLGYVAFYAVGAYSFALISTNFGLGFWECLPLAGILAACWGMFLGFPVLRLRGDYLAIVTLAFGEIIRLVITNWVSLTGGPNGMIGMPAPQPVRAALFHGRRAGHFCRVLRHRPRIPASARPFCITSFSPWLCSPTG